MLTVLFAAPYKSHAKPNVSLSHRPPSDGFSLLSAAPTTRRGVWFFSPQRDFRSLLQAAGLKETQLADKQSFLRGLRILTLLFRKRVFVLRQKR